MHILAVDTASKTCSVAVIQNRSILAEILEGSGETHSRHLMTMIEHVLDVSHLSIRDLQGMAVTKGPGSFTGLRIGISTVKGLSLVSGKPVVGVSTLDAMASQYQCPGMQVAIWLDARKKEVYCARYRFDGQRHRKIDPDRVLSPAEAVRGISEPCLFIGDGAAKYREQIKQALEHRAYFGCQGQDVIRASSVGLLSVAMFASGQVDTYDTLMPYYIRKSEAETARKI